MRTLGIAAVLVALAAPCTGQLLYPLGEPLPDAFAEEAGKKPPKPKPDCLDGVVYDDRKFETGLAPGSLAARGDFVMLFEAKSYPARLNRVCLAWRRTSFWNALYFDLRVWAADGEDGAPGTLLHTVPVLGAGSVPTKAKFYSYDVAWADIVIDGPVYIGPSWDPLDAFLIYLAMDKGPKTKVRRGYYGGVLFDNEVKAPSVALGSSINAAPGYRALGIRAVFGPP